MHVAPGDPRRDRVVRMLLSQAKELSRQDLSEQRAGNRALLAGRLEALWQACLPHVTGDPEVHVDFRFLDLGLRVTKELRVLLEVDREDPPAPEAPVEVGRHPAAVEVSAQLEALEARHRGEG